MAPLSEIKFKLGAYLVLPKHNKLILNGNEFKLEPKIMQVLCYLIAHKGEVVSRGKIAEALWPDTVTGLEVVTRAIFELRKILKDDPKEPTYIETIARKGYCFIYDDSDLKENLANDRVSKENLKRQSSQLLSMLLAISFVLAIIAFAVFQTLMNTADEVSSSSLQATFLTDIDSFSNSPALSPDGKYVLFTKKKHFKETKNQLVLLNLESQKQTVISDNAEYKNPQWLINAKHWYYVKCHQSVNCEIIKHNILSGEKVSLYKVKHSILYLAVSIESQRLFLSILIDNSIQIVQVNLEKTPLEPIIIDTPETSNRHLLLGHDHKILYFVSTVLGGASHLYQYDIAKQKYQLINDQFSRLYGLSLKDDKALWVVGDLNGQKGLWSFDIANQKVKSAFTSIPSHTPMLVTSQINLNMLVYTNRTRTINIESIGEFGISEISNANSSMIDMHAVYSPNAKVLYFTSNRNGLYDIWKLQAGDVERVTNIKANMIERPILSIQEDRLAFVTRTKSNTEITIFDINNKTEQKKIFLSTKVFLLSWSNDQKFIYFSTFEGEQYNIYKLNVLTSEKEKILLNAGAIAQESQDGKFLYYGDMLNGQLMRRSNVGEVDIMFKLPASDIQGIMPHRLKIINDSFYYITAQGNKSVLKRYSFTDKTLQVYRELPSDIYVTDIVKGETVGVIYDRFSEMNSKLIQLH